jgi:hypothetical protein
VQHEIAPIPLSEKLGAAQLNGIDRWIGGVHLQGHHVPWRWDDGTETIVRIPRD